MGVSASGHFACHTRMRAQEGPIGLRERIAGTQVDAWRGCGSSSAPGCGDAVPARVPQVSCHAAGLTCRGSTAQTMTVEYVLHVRSAMEHDSQHIAPGSGWCYLACLKRSSKGWARSELWPGNLERLWGNEAAANACVYRE